MCRLFASRVRRKKQLLIKLCFLRLSSPSFIQVGWLSSMEREREELKSMSLGDHLEELRSRLILLIAGIFIGLIVCLFFGKYFVALLTGPYNRAMDLPDGTMHLQTIQPAEGFLVYIKICLFFGVLVSSPWVFWQIWAFVSSGLYRHERKFIYAVAPISATLFVTGSVFVQDGGQLAKI